MSSLKFRLSAMMFLEYAVTGSIVPILSHYLKNTLQFEPYQVGQILGVTALAAVVAPFLASHVADRYIRSERMLALCHIVAAVLMLALSRQTHFWPFLIIYFVYGLAFTPTLGLTNAVVMHNVEDPRRDFGGIRMWGTAAWPFVGFLSILWLRNGGEVGQMLYVSAGASLLLALYSLGALPKSEISARHERTSVMYWKALQVLASPSLLFLCIITFVSSMTHQIYYLGMSPYLSQNGFANEYIMPTMSLGQASEAVMLGLLGVCLARISIKSAMVLALLAQAARYVLFAAGTTALPIVLGITLHGVCYAFFFTAAYIYVDQHSDKQTRAGAQQLFTVIISGLGTAAAYVAGGYLAQWLKMPRTGLVDYRTFWFTAAAASALTALVMVAFFRETAPQKAVAESIEDTMQTATE